MNKSAAILFINFSLNTFDFLTKHDVCVIRLNGAKILSS